MRLRTLAAIALLTAGCATAQPGRSNRPVFDHHNHVQSAAVVDAMQRSCRRNPPLCPPVQPAVRTGDDVLRELDDAGIGGSTLLSTAYLFGLPELKAEKLDIAALVRAENAFTLEQWKRAPRRLVPVVSVPVLEPFAPAELAHWLKRPEVAAVKLHLTTAGFSFRKPEHVAALARLVGQAAAARRGIVIHMRTLDPGYGAEDVRIFVRDVLPAAGSAPVQIAHAGGWGGFDRKTEAALEEFARLADAGYLPGNLLIEISAIAMPGVSAERLQLAVDKLRRLGIRRVLFGSDSGLGFSIGEGWQRTRAMAFTEEEWRVIRRNRAAYARR